MKPIKKIVFITLLGTWIFTALPTSEVKAAIPIAEIIRQAVIKVIKAVDLMIQRLQNKTIWLQNAQKVLENKLSQFKLKEIADWTEKQRQLYKKYYDELWQVRHLLETYHQIERIIRQQKNMAAQYKFMWQMLNRDKHFTKPEKDYMYQVYTGIINESLDHLNQLLLVTHSYKTQMTDAQRWDMIQQIADRIDKNYQDFRQFNDQNIRLSINRAKDEHDITIVKQLYGLPAE